jgi:hypothetical protein
MKRHTMLFEDFSERGQGEKKHWFVMTVSDGWDDSEKEEVYAFDSPEEAEESYLDMVARSYPDLGVEREDLARERAIKDKGMTGDAAADGVEDYMSVLTDEERMEVEDEAISYATSVMGFEKEITEVEEGSEKWRDLLDGIDGDKEFAYVFSGASPESRERARMLYQKRKRSSGAFGRF